MSNSDAMSDRQVQGVLTHYPSIPRGVRVERECKHGGFSGAEIFKVGPTTSAEYYCLKRWPVEMQDESRLERIHGILARVFRNGLCVVPVPLVTQDQTTYVSHDGALWELAPWMPGSVESFESKSVERLEAAVQVLADFHLATEEGRPLSGRPQGLLDRWTRVEQVKKWNFSTVRGQIEQGAYPKLSGDAQLFLDAFMVHGKSLAVALDRARAWRVPLQAVIRDVRKEHFLYERNKVTGLIDFGAMREDHVGLDVAHLLGSFCGDDEEGWQNGLRQYQVIVRRFEPVEIELIRLFDRANVLLSGLNWIRWLYMERRQFDDLTAVGVRFKAIAQRVRRIN